MCITKSPAGRGGNLENLHGTKLCKARAEELGIHYGQCTMAALAGMPGQ
jgi:hypothetical protein